MLKKTLILSLLAAFGSATFAADYYVVVPVQGKQHLVDGISVALSATPLPTGVVGVPYAGFNLSTALVVTGDPAYSSTKVDWSVAAGALPAGLTLAKGVISGVPSAAGAHAFTAQAVYRTKVGQQSYSIEVLTERNLVLQAGGYRTWADGTVATSCKAYLQGSTNYAYAGATGDGTYRIDVDGAGALTAFDVRCDMTTAGGGWTVIQQRSTGAVDFYRQYAPYAAGFGTAATEYWLGNDRIAAMTAAGSHSLRFDLSRSNGQKVYETYSSFKVNGASDGYRLTVSGPSGTAGDSFSYHSGFKFTTNDVDQDSYAVASSINMPAGQTSSNCARVYSGAWWYGACHYSNLNGLYLNGPYTSWSANGMTWFVLAGDQESMKTTEMKVREN